MKDFKVHNGKERRKSIRFKIRGATVNYVQPLPFFSSIAYSEEFCPIVNISRGGIQFVSRKFLKFVKKILMQIYIPDEKSYLNLMGRIRWSSFNPFDDYNYQVGVQFEPFEGRKIDNQSKTLKKLVSLEKKFLPKNSSSL